MYHMNHKMIVRNSINSYHLDKDKHKHKENNRTDKTQMLKVIFKVVNKLMILMKKAKTHMMNKKNRYLNLIQNSPREE